jgi:Protein of unknown function (DUF1257)
VSSYSTNETKFKDPTLLMAALQEMGFPIEEIEYHTKAVNLYGYHGDMREDTAEIVLRSKYVNARLSTGASNDIGLKLQADGTYAGIISGYDSNFANTAWLGRLSAAYARKSVIQNAAKQGLRFAGTVKQNGKTQLHFVQA